MIVDLLSLNEIFNTLCDPLNSYELVNIFFGVLSSDELVDILVFLALESLSKSFSIFSTLEHLDYFQLQDRLPR